MNREPYQQKSRMVKISMSGSGEGRGWVTGPGYSTDVDFPVPLARQHLLWCTEVAQPLDLTSSLSPNWVLPRIEF